MATVGGDQVRALYEQSTPVLISNLANGVIVVATCWQHASRPLLLLWAAAVVVMGAARFGLRRAYVRAAVPDVDESIWARRFVVGSFAAGALWGIGGAWLFDVNGVWSRMLLPFVIGGMGAAAAGTISCYLPAFWAFLVPSMLPLVVRVIALGDSVHVAMGAMMVVYVIGIGVVARNTNRALNRAFQLHIDNTRLLEEATRAKESMEAINRQLESRVAERTAAFERQSEALRTAQRLEAVGRLAGGVAHDFNNLLTVVLGNVGLMVDREDLDAETRAALLEVRGAAERGSELVRQLLAFGRRQYMQPTEVDLNAVVSELRPLLERLLAAPISLELSLTREPLVVKVDRSQVDQVLINLVTNARDAIGGGGRIEIESAAIPLDEVTGTRLARLSVSDDGCGMDEETRRRAFEPFFTTKTLGRGTGLGLATVQGIVEQSGGSIELASGPGSGSRFTIYLPRIETQLAKPEAPAPSRTWDGGAITILVAEDDLVVRTVTTRALERLGHRVLAADGGETALATARQFPGTIDLLITDMVMNEMNGAELARRLSNERPGIRVLVVSGYRRDEHLAPDDVRLPHDFLPKPFTAQALAAKVATLMSRPAPDADPRAAGT